MNDIVFHSSSLPNPSERPKIYLRVDPRPSSDPGLPVKVIMREGLGTGIGKVAADEKCCCNCGCFLPYTVTVQFNGLVDKTHTHHCDLTIKSSFGGGAKAVGMMPGGKDPEDRGPLSSVLLVDGGSGYATIGRSQPTLTFKGSGKGAVFTPTLSEHQDEYGCPVWFVDSISVTGGKGYTDGEILIVTMGKDDTYLESTTQAELKVKILHGEPNITASVNGGENAQLSVSLQIDENNPPHWIVSNVLVQNGGTGYFPKYPQINATIPVVFNTHGAKLVNGYIPVTAVAYPAIKMPENLIKETEGSGIDGDFNFIFEQILEPVPWGQTVCWHVVDVEIINGGFNYVVGDEFSITAAGDWSGLNFAYGQVTEVDENGSILAVQLISDGRFRESIDGSIDGIYIISQGLYYVDLGKGEPISVNIIDPGSYYKKDPDQPSCVSQVEVTPCGGGDGAIIEAVIDEDARSPTFGQIIDLIITNPGDDYLVWNWANCTAHSKLDGKEFVLRAVDPRELIGLTLESCFGSGGAAEVENKGERFEPTLEISAPCSEANITYTLEKHENPEEECHPYWSISDISVSGGLYCPDEFKPIIGDGDCGLVVEEPADIDIFANSGILTHAIINNSGRYYKQFEWDGQPSPIYSVALTHNAFPTNRYAKLGRKEPNIIINAPDGTGANFEFDLIERKDKCEIPYWIIKNLTVSDGNDYTDGSYLTVSSEDENFVEEIPLVAQIFTREKPDIAATIVSTEGSGATINIKLQEKYISGHKTWIISSVSGGGGKDYSNDAHVELDYGEATEEIAAEFYLVIKHGKICSISIIENGSYYIDNGIPQEIKLFNGGKYYTEDTELDPYVADIKVIITQKEQSNGYGAEIEVEIDDDTSSPSFGFIKRLILVKCGENYSYFGGPLDCSYFGGCQAGCDVAEPNNGNPSIISISLDMPKEKNKPMNLVLYDNDYNTYQPIDIHFKSDDIEDCNNPFPVNGYVWWGAPSGGEVLINASGIWDSTGTDNCPMPSCSPIPSEPPTTTTPLEFMEPLVFNIEHGTTSSIPNDQTISFESNIPCLGGTISSSGTLNNLNTKFIWIKNNIENICHIFMDIQSNKFTYTDESFEYKYQIIVWIINPPDGLNVAEWTPNKSPYTNQIKIIDNGYLSGSITIAGNDGYWISLKL